MCQSNEDSFGFEFEFSSKKYMKPTTSKWRVKIPVIAETELIVNATTVEDAAIEAINRYGDERYEYRVSVFVEDDWIDFDVVTEQTYKANRCKPKR